MTNLCIDWGNTRVKAAIFSHDFLKVADNFSEEDALTGIIGLAQEYAPAAAIISSVAHHPPELEVLLKEHCPLVAFNTDTNLTIMNAYGSPETLGLDRLAIAVGINNRFRNEDALAISIGTAITYNFVQKNNIFRGGQISPGVRLRLRALHEFTDKLPLVSQEGSVPLLGYDTESSIRSGVMLGIAAEIDGMIANYQAQYPGINVVLTGGDAPFFDNKLKNRIFADSQLLMQGLHSILKHNVR